MESNPEAAKVFRLSEEYVRLPPLRRGSQNRNIWSDDIDEVEMKALRHQQRRRSRSSSHSFQEDDLARQWETGLPAEDHLPGIGEEGRSSLDELIEGEVPKRLRM